MLSNEALSSAIPLATIVDSQDYGIVAKGNTPLAALIGATGWSIPAQITPAPGDCDYMPDTSSMQYLANQPIDGVGGSQHDMTMDCLIKDLAPLVAQHISHAKNVVRPAVAALVEGTVKGVAEFGRSSLNEMEVIIWNPPAPIYTGNLESMVRKFQSIPYDNLQLSVKLPMLTDEVLVETMLTLNPKLDSAILEWVAAKGSTFFRNVWEQAFQNKEAGFNQMAITFNDLINDKENGVDNAVAIFLLADKLYENPPEGTEMPLAAYSNAMARFREQAALRVVSFIEKLNQDEKAGVLIVRLAGTNKITVNGNLYTNWVASGGSNEVLFANLLTGNPSFTIAAINDRAGELKASWERHVAITTTFDSTEKYRLTVELLLAVYRKQLDDVSEEERLTDVTGRERKLAAFKSELKRVSESDLANNLWGTCLKLVCRSSFPDTDAERILSDIDTISKDSSILNVREAAALATIKYIGRWIVGQMATVPY